MKTVLAILVWTLSLFGIEVGNQVHTDRIRANGTDVLVSRVVARPTGTGVECVRSASGQCYYTVFAEACTPGSARRGEACGEPIDRFALAGGERRQVATLAHVRVCVRADAAATRSDCD